MELITNIVISLLSAAVGGIVGGYVGYRGAIRAQTIEDARRRQAAARALLVEVSSNHRGTHELSRDLYNAVPDRWPDFDGTRYYAKNVWRDALPQVAPMLRWKELEKVSNAYWSMEVALHQIRQAGDGVQKNSPVDRWSNFRSTLQEIEGHSLRVALQEFGDATELLSAKVLDKLKGEKLAPILR